jgi:DNA gyrase inhibitor GyrI
MTVFSISTIALAVVGSLAWSFTARGAYESAEYRVVETDGSIEIREYPELTVVSTSSNADMQGSDGSFMRLFRYISGENATQEKVSMTTPVFMEGVQQASEVRMSFVVPKDVALRGAPQPKGDGVDLTTRPAGRYAVLRFSGRLDAKTAAKAEEQLRSWLTSRSLNPVASMEYAGYDPPWTPGPLRRNEVLVRIGD